jgi:hypothetical protein
MATQVQWRGGSTAEHSTFTGAAREVTVDTQKKTLVVHDGSTAGGEPLLREDQANLPTSVTNGISVPSANNVAISTNGTGRLFVDSSGNVGVGTTSPIGNLTVNLSSTDKNISFNGAQGEVGSVPALVAHTNAGALQSMGFRGVDLRFATGSAERLRITSDGKLGLGTSSPAYTLEVSAGTTDTVASFNSSDANAWIQIRDNSTTDTAVMVGAVGDDMRLRAGSNERVRITSAGNVGIGTTAAPGKLTVATSSANPTAGLFSWSGGYSVVAPGGTSTSGGVGISFNTTDNVGGISCAEPSVSWRPLVYKAAAHRFELGTTEAARIDGSGRLLVGTSSAMETFTSAVIQAATSAGGTVVLGRNTSSVSADQSLGGIYFNTYAGGAWNEAATIACAADATQGAGDYPSRLVFSTTADGASSPTERMRILNDGVVLTATTSTTVAAGGSGTFGHRISSSGLCLQVASEVYAAAAFNRANNDGSVVEIRQGGIVEGTISVSGSTVSYNGAHLARWSQLPGGAERTEILRGSVLSNIDEMCDWVEEENEQLNRMKISDVEGDKNVSGVFQAWDDDDDIYTNDFYCAMTGDFVIRIAQGVTVERGDLLMSAGDGTAKPQDDDIIRSKTIAKVTSTHVSETYADGSYCVPCVLMAC